MSSPSRLLVVALDFGTTYSGYAYSFHEDYLKDALKVTSQNFRCGNLQTAKVPTSVLFNPKQAFHSFGLEAETKYAQLCDEKPNEAKKWFFFEKFKMTLHENPAIARDMVLMDQTTKKGLPALQVFSSAIAFLKEDFTARLHQAGLQQVHQDEITWVLTVPAIWEDQSRQFMKEAAVKAGIPEAQLTLALEPEAASVFCLQSYGRQQSLTEPGFVAAPGKKFMLVDCGGGTIDISVFEIKDKSSLRHLHGPVGTNGGGTQVDKAFKDFLYQLVGFEGLTAFDKMETLQLFQEFESAKRSFCEGNDKLVIKVPESLRLAVETSVRVKSSEHVKYVKYNLVLEKPVALPFFSPSSQSIVGAMQGVLQHESVQKVDAILLAGGLSEADVIQKAVKEAFPRDLVLVAPSPSVSVLAGAVMYGHNPDVIATRVSAFTYGVGSWLPFQEGVHNPQYLETRGGVKMSRRCFDVFIQADQEVEVNQLLPYRVSGPADRGQTTMYVAIYRTKKKKPVHVDEAGVQKIATVKVELGQEKLGRQRLVKETMRVGGTELQFLAVDSDTGKEFSITCDFLAKG